jgi:tetratricopeptide (TPR) repeat protein/GGDEF domain-containing protein
MLFLVCLYQTGTCSINLLRGGIEGWFIPKTVIREPFENLTKPTCPVNLPRKGLQLWPASADFFLGMVNTDKLFQKAGKLLQKQKFDSALELFLKILDHEPNNEAVLLNLADLSLRLGQPPDFLRYSSLLTDFYIEREDTAKAIVTCRKILKADPHNVSALAKLAPLLKQSHNQEEAAEAFREAAAALRAEGNSAQALECLRQLVEIEPGNLDAQTELAELAVDTGKPQLGATAFLRASEIARSQGLDGRWAMLAERAHRVDPSNKAGCVAAAEVCLARERACEAAVHLEPICQADPDDPTASKLLCHAYLSLGEYTKAEPLSLKLFQAHPDSIELTEQLIRGLLSHGETSRAVGILLGIKKQMSLRQGKKNEFLALAEQVYHADENNLDILELLPPIYNELNRDGDLRLALARLFNLYLAGERFDKAAETLESILDVDPYGAAHADRLLNLEGHIDAIWYKTIAARISIPGVGHGTTPRFSQESDEEPEADSPASLEDLIVEAEMYHRYHLTAKLKETLKRIDRLHPGAHLDNQSLNELYEMVGFEPAPFECPAAGKPGEPEGASVKLPLEELGKLASIAAIIHRQGTPERVLRTAAEQLGRHVGASRCWITAGPADSTTLTAEYVAPGLAPSDNDAALAVCSFLTEFSSVSSACLSIDNVSAAKDLEPVSPQISQMGIVSLLAAPLMDKEQKVGLLLLEQCQSPRRWTGGEKMLAKSVASQVAIAIHSTRLRRLVRSLAGTDLASGLLPRSAYLDCLLAEARRAVEQSRPLSVCLLEPADAEGLSKKLGAAGMQSYIQRTGSIISSHVRQNDVAIRYGPHTVALCLPDTPLAHSRHLAGKLQAKLCQNKINADYAPDVCAAIGDLTLGPGFDAVDAVTEVINRLETLMETLRKQPEARILVSRFPG